VRILSTEQLTTTVVPVVACLILLAVQPFSIQTESVVISNNTLLNPNWIIGYCSPIQSNITKCNPQISSENGLLSLSTVSTVSTYLIELPISYGSVVSHQKLNYDLTLSLPQISNVTLRFSEVVSNVYFSTPLANLTSIQSYSTAQQSLNVLRVEESFGAILDQPVRLQIDMAPSSNRLLVGLVMRGGDVETVGHYLGSNSILLSLAVASFGVYYATVPKDRKLRKLSSIYIAAGIATGAYSVSFDLFQSWPPISVEFVWTFLLGAVVGTVLLTMYVIYDVHWN